MSDKNEKWTWLRFNLALVFTFFFQSALLLVFGGAVFDLQSTQDWAGWLPFAILIPAVVVIFDWQYALHAISDGQTSAKKWIALALRIALPICFALSLGVLAGIQVFKVSIEKYLAELGRDIQQAILIDVSELYDAQTANLKRQLEFLRAALSEQSGLSGFTSNGTTISERLNAQVLDREQKYSIANASYVRAQGRLDCEIGGVGAECPDGEASELEGDGELAKKLRVLEGNAKRNRDEAYDALQVAKQELAEELRRLSAENQEQAQVLKALTEARAKTADDIRAIQGNIISRVSNRSKQINHIASKHPDWERSGDPGLLFQLVALKAIASENSVTLILIIAIKGILIGVDLLPLMMVPALRDTQRAFDARVEQDAFREREFALVHKADLIAFEREQELWTLQYEASLQRALNQIGAQNTIQAARESSRSRGFLATLFSLQTPFSSNPS